MMPQGVRDCIFPCEGKGSEFESRWGNEGERGKCKHALVAQWIERNFAEVEAVGPIPTQGIRLCSSVDRALVAASLAKGHWFKSSRGHRGEIHILRRGASLLLASKKFTV